VILLCCIHDDLSSVNKCGVSELFGQYMRVAVHTHSVTGPTVLWHPVLQIYQELYHGKIPGWFNRTKHQQCRI